MLTVIIPTYNELENLQTLLPFLLEKGGDRVDQIIVCDSPQSHDSPEGQTWPTRVKIKKASVHRRSIQLNEGAGGVLSPWLYFLHADTRPPASFISLIEQAISKGAEAGCFAYDLDVDHNHFSFLQKFMLRINSRMTRRQGIFTGGGDQGLFIARDLFLKMGGYKNDLRLMEDFDFYDRLRAIDTPFELIKEPALVSARKYTKNSWLRVNYYQLLVFLAYKMNMPQDVWERVYQNVR